MFVVSAYTGWDLPRLEAGILCLVERCDNLKLLFVQLTHSMPLFFGTLGETERKQFSDTLL
jgi:hypothetical protein